ncbi:MAG: hypothetical protein WAU48_04315, partial [Gammaproteobacteria bacterium]
MGRSQDRNRVRSLVQLQVLSPVHKLDPSQPQQRVPNPEHLSQVLNLVANPVTRPVQTADRVLQANQQEWAAHRLAVQPKLQALVEPEMQQVQAAVQRARVAQARLEAQAELQGLPVRLAAAAADQAL